MRYVTVVASVLLLPAATLANDKYEPCPPLPPVAPASDIMRDAGVLAALADVKSLLREKAATLPSGLVATIVYDQETLWSGGFGKRNKFDQGSPVPGPSDLVRIASITKVFTDILLFALRDAGVVSLDDPVRKYLPNLSLGKLGDTRGEITLRNLAAHLSGLPREVPFPCSFEGQACAEADVLQVLNGSLPVLPPNRKFHYSNLGIAILGRALAHAIGDGPSYEALVGKYITGPLGMENATFNTSLALERDLIATGTKTDGSAVNFSATCVPAAEAPGSWMAPCGCLWASAADISQLMKLFLRESSAAAAGTSQIIDGDTIAEMLAPSVLLGDGSSAVGTPWEMKYSEGVWVKSKQGELPGYRSSVSIVEPLKLGVFTSALVSDVDELSVWSIPSLDILIPAVTAASWKIAASHAPVLPSKSQAMVGDYYKPGTVSVTKRGAVLILSGVGSQDMNLTAIPGVDPNLALRAKPINSTAGCRWLDDGSDLEIAYFDWKADDSVWRLRFMDGAYGKLEV